MATPIGNPGDFSPRARDILAHADIILAEDTRRAKFLLGKCAVHAKKLLSFFEHNENDRQEKILAALRDGKDIAVITDAGTPLLSDPGYKLVRSCRQANIHVSPVPGPSAPLAALSAAGIAPLPFTFLGFLPRGVKARKDVFSLYGTAPATLVFFERKDRVAESMALARECLGEREYAICRELTKEHEEFIVGSLADKTSLPDNLLGEITIIIGPPAKDFRTPLSEARQMLEDALARGLKNREAAKFVKERCRGWTTAELYGFIAKETLQAQTANKVKNGVY